MRHRSLVFLLTCVLAGAAHGQALTSQLRNLVRNTDLGHTRVAFCVIDLSDRSLVANDGAGEAMIPASNMKLITTAAALAVLGPDFRFVTELGLVEPEQPDRPPSLIVVGDGDPAFGDPILLRRFGYRVDDLLDQWIGAVRDSGHTHFAELILDDRVFDYNFAHPTWEAADQVKISGAQVAGINFFRNGLNVTVVPTRRGQSPQITLFPPAPFLPTTNRAVTGSRDFFTIDRRIGTNQITFDGQIKNHQSAPYFVTIHDPPMVFGQILAHRFIESGVRIDAVRRLSPDEVTPDYLPLHRYTTTLQLVLERTNQDSQNMFAEALFKRIGREVTGESGSWANGAAAIRQVLHQMLGTRASAITIADGSGLSRDNRVTAQLLAELLAAMARDKRLAEPFFHSLSHAGENGTLANRFDHGFPAEVYGKSGYLRGVTTLSGYLVVPAEGEREQRRFAFSILFNDYKTPVTNTDLKALQEQMLLRVVEHVRRGEL